MNNILLLAFALPVATVLLAIVLQKVLRSPMLVAATFFAILLILTYTVADSSFLVFAILYTILAFVTASLTRIICNTISSNGNLTNRTRTLSMQDDNSTITVTSTNNLNSNTINNSAIRNGTCGCRCNRR